MICCLSSDDNKGRHDDDNNDDFDNGSRLKRSSAIIVVLLFSRVVVQAVSVLRDTTVVRRRSRINDDNVLVDDVDADKKDEVEGRIISCTLLPSGTLVWKSPYKFYNTNKYLHKDKILYIFVCLIFLT